MDRLPPVALAALGAVAAWLSLGVIASVEPFTGARVGMWAPWWAVALLLTSAVGLVLWKRVPAARLWPLALSVLACLPWLPGPIPPAFLIWNGPVLQLLWTLIALGLAAPLLKRLTRGGWARDPVRAPWILALTVALASAAGAWEVQERLPAGDEPHYLVITQSLLLDADLRIENNHQRGDFAVYHPRELRPDYLQRGQDGQIYSIHAPGVSVLVAPAFAVLGWPGAVLTMIAMAALAAALVWLAAWRLTGGDATAGWVAGAALAFSAPGYVHGFTIFPDGAGALAVAIALTLVIKLERLEQVSDRALITAGAALAMLPWLHTRFSVLAGGMGLILLLRLLPRPSPVRAMALLFSIPVVSAIAWFGFFWIYWGTPNPAAPYGQATQSAWAHLKPAVPGLLFDQQFGLIANAPIYAAALLGLVSLWIRHRRLALELGVLFWIYLLAVGSYRMWWGGHSAPARFLVAALPLLAPPLAAWWHQGSAARRSLTLLLFALGLATLIPRIVVEHGALLFNDRDGYDVMLDWANRSVNLPLAWPSLHRDIVTDAWRDIAIWTGVAGLCATLAILAGRRFGQAWTWSVSAAAVTVMAASSLVWSGPAESVTPNASAINLLQHVPYTAWGTGWRSAPWGTIEASSVWTALNLATTRRAGVALARSAPLFTAPFLPGGRYALVVEGQRLGGRLAILVGRTTQVLESFELDGREPGQVGFVTLPATAHSLTVQGDDRAKSSVTRVVLHPIRVGPAAGAPRQWVRRGTRYGPLRVMFFDDNAFMEPPGFWTRGSAATALFVDTLDAGSATETASGPAAFRVRAGPVPAHVAVSTGEWRQVLDLQAGETTLVELPSGHPRGWPVQIETSTGFRPAEHDPASKDVRNLGVWVEAALER